MSIKLTNEGSSLGYCHCGEMIFVGKHGCTCDKCNRKYNAVGQEIRSHDYYDEDGND